MKRWHDEKKIAKKRLKDRKKLCNVANDKFAKLGYFRKKDAHDCGNPECKMCHFNKIYDIKSNKQKAEDFSFKEQVKEAS